MYHEKELKARHELFCREYIKDFNGKQACLRAGISTLKSAGPYSCKLLKRADIRKRIDELTKVDDNYYNNLRRRIISEQTTIAFSDLNETYDLKKMTLKQLSEVDGRLIQQAKLNSDGTLNIKLWDKQKALEFLGRHLGMLQDKVDLTTDGERIDIHLNSSDVKKALDEATGGN